MSNIVTHLGKNLNWYTYRNGINTFTTTFTSDSNPFDISTRSFSCNIRKVGFSDNIVTLTEADGIVNNGSDGTLVITLTETKIANLLPKDNYFYEIIYEIDDETYPLFQGMLRIIAEENPVSSNTSVNAVINLSGTNVNVAVTLAGGNSGGGSFTATASGTNTYTATLNPPITSYSSSHRYYILFTNGNTGAATLNLNSLGAKDIKKNSNDALSSGDISSGQILELAYDGTNFQIIGGVTQTNTWKTSGTTTLAGATTIEAGTNSLTLNNAAQGSLIQMSSPNVLLRYLSVSTGIFQLATGSSVWRQGNGTATHGIVLTNASMTIEDALNTTGLRYQADFSTNGKALGARWIPDWGAVLGAKTFTGAQTFSLPPVLPSHTVSNAPSASSYTGGLILVTNEAGGAVVAFSDGTNWRRVTDRQIISQ